MSELEIDSKQISQLKELLSQNNINVKTILMNTDFPTEPIICVGQDTVINKDYFIYVIDNQQDGNTQSHQFVKWLKQNKGLSNINKSQFTPCIIKEFTLKKLTFIQLERQCTSVREYLNKDTRFCFERFINILLQFISGVEYLQENGYYIQNINIESINIRQDNQRDSNSLFLFPLTLSTEQQYLSNTHLHFQDILNQLIALAELYSDSVSEQPNILHQHFLQLLYKLSGSNINEISCLNEMQGQQLTNYMKEEIMIYLRENRTMIEQEIKSLVENDNLNRAQLGLELLTQALPQNYKILFELGSICKKGGKIDQAVKYLKQSAKVNDQSDDCLNEIGCIYLYELMLVDEAIPYFQNSIAINHTNPESYYYLAYCYLNLGQSDQSIPLYQKCLEIYDNHALALLDLGWQNYLLGNLEIAIAYYNKSLKADNKIDSTLMNLVNCLYILNREDETAYIIEQVSSLQGLLDYTHRLIVLDPLNAFLYHDLGFINFIKRDYIKAYVAFKKCLEINSNYIYKNFLIKQIQSLQQYI